MNKKTIDDLSLENKKVLVRVDFNVPIENGKIMSDKRIKAVLPTVRKIIKDQGIAILFSHLGRIKSAKDLKKKSLRPVAKRLGELLGQKVEFAPQTRGEILEKAINKLKPGAVLLVENTRFEDFNNNNAESGNDPELANYWASLGDVFINDAFGTAHREHASNVGIAKYSRETAIGYLIQYELKMLQKGLDNPESPFVAIIGGAKISDKINVVKNLLKKADKILIGGAMAYTFLKAKGHKIGSSKYEENYLNKAKEFLSEGKNKIYLPIDHVVSKTLEDIKGKVTENEEIEDGYIGMDIGPKTIELYSKQIAGAKTVVWNGPMGVTEFKNYTAGTDAIARVVASQKEVYSIIGGGDSAAAAIKLGFEKKFTHISTGGGASLRYIEGKKLPGIEAIEEAF